MKDKETMVNIGEIHLESDPSSGRVVVLKEKGGAERRLTMWVGDSEFAAIAKEKGLIAPKRPLTHDLYLQMIEVSSRVPPCRNLRVAGGYILRQGDLLR